MGLGGPPRYEGTRWYITADDQGTFEVAKRGRPVGSGLSIAQARQMLRKKMQRGDQAYLVDADGQSRRLQPAR